MDSCLICLSRITFRSCFDINFLPSLCFGLCQGNVPNPNDNLGCSGGFQNLQVETAVPKVALKLFRIAVLAMLNLGEVIA